MGTSAPNAASIGVTIVVLGVLGLIVWVVVGFVRIRRATWRTRAERNAFLRRCACGYSFTGLDMPRCPECGRAVGFNKTFDELGVPEQEVVEHVRRRAEELRDKPLPEEAREALRLLGEMERKLRIDDLPAGAVESLRAFDANGKKSSHEQGPTPTRPA